MLKGKALTQFAVRGETVYPGDTFEDTEKNLNYLVGARKAVRYTEPAKGEGKSAKGDK